jgi:hypothetical protein
VAGTMSNSPHGDETIIWNDKSKWSGANDDDARRSAAITLANFINNYDYKDGEQLNLVGHSHGGNVIKEASHKISRDINNVVTLGTPQRGDHKMNMSKVQNYVNVYSMWDGIQIGGGEFFDNKPIRWAANKLGVKINSFEGGFAGRTDNNATKNIWTGFSAFSDPYHAHGKMWNNVDIWTNYVAPVIKLPESKK